MGVFLLASVVVVAREMFWLITDKAPVLIVFVIVGIVALARSYGNSSAE
jgi:hypothetical protein